MPTIKNKTEKPLLERFYDNENNNKYELCIDEAGRGCLFGRVYIACVVLPKNEEDFSGVDIKDSKKFSSKTKLNEKADYIKKHAIAWHITYIESDVIDNINILKSVMNGMHDCIQETMLKHQINIQNKTKMGDYMAVIDGNYFTPYTRFDTEKEMICQLEHATVEKGDGKYMGIAAASILAKSARDNYVLELCEKYPDLVTMYGLDTNMGYGTKKHREGIDEFGITNYHRRSFGCCKQAKIETSIENI